MRVWREITEEEQELRYYKQLEHQLMIIYQRAAENGRRFVFEALGKSFEFLKISLGEIEETFRDSLLADCPDGAFAHKLSGTYIIQTGCVTCAKTKGDFLVFVISDFFRSKAMPDQVAKRLALHAYLEAKNGGDHKSALEQEEVTRLTYKGKAWLNRFCSDRARRDYPHFPFFQPRNPVLSRLLQRKKIFPYTREVWEDKVASFLHSMHQEF